MPQKANTWPWVQIEPTHDYDFQRKFGLQTRKAGYFVAFESDEGEGYDIYRYPNRPTLDRELAGFDLCDRDPIAEGVTLFGALDHIPAPE